MDYPASPPIPPPRRIFRPGTPAATGTLRHRSGRILPPRESAARPPGGALNVIDPLEDVVTGLHAAGDLGFTLATPPTVTGTTCSPLLTSVTVA